MVSSGGRWVLAYNGEIYNHREVRHRLEQGGTLFRSSSDTEVLLAAVERWGVDRALDACEGMFAAALWDRRDRVLHLVRDRFGEKPLYYGWVGKVFAFGSELKALCALPGFGAELNRRAVASYLRHNCVPAPDTIWQGVRKLVPGHLVTLHAPTPGVLPEQRCYWSAADAVDAGATQQADRLGLRDDRSARERIVGRSGRQDGCRRPCGSIPFGRDRFEHHCGPDAAACLATSTHLYGWVRRSILRRVIRGGGGRCAPRNRPHGGPCRRCRGDGRHPPSGGHLGRAFRRRLPDPDLSCQPSGSPRRDRIVVGGWRRRAVRWIQPARLARPCVAEGRRCAGGGSPDCRLRAGQYPARSDRAGRPRHPDLPDRLAGAKPINQGSQAGPGTLRLGPRWTPIGPSPPTGMMRRRWCSGTTMETRQTIAAVRPSPMGGSPS